MKPIKLYWWRGEGEANPDRRNFGDYLSPLLIEMVARRPVVYAPARDADLIGIGTILAKSRKARNIIGWPRPLHIWGSGAGSGDDRLSSRHHYHAVRGKLTQACVEKYCGAVAGLAKGDPGLLAAEYWSGRPRPPKKYRLGVVPHFVDQASPFIKNLLEMQGSHMIDVFLPPAEVIREILMCDHVISSSLHGLIVSDAFHIPNRRMVVSEQVKFDMKYDDYYSAFGLRQPAPLHARELAKQHGLEQLVEGYQEKNIDPICSGLIHSFPHLS
jgi:pyruvyltransferase